MRWAKAVGFGVAVLALPACAGAGGFRQFAEVNPNERAQVQDACSAKARAEKMEITNWHGIREVSQGQFQADVIVQYKGAPYQRVCKYNSHSKSVDITENPGQGGMADVGNQLTTRERAKQACEAKAASDKIEVLRWAPFQEVKPDIWESDIRVRWKGQEYDRTCVYKDKSENVDIRERR